MYAEAFFNGCGWNTESSERIVELNARQARWTCRAIPNPAGMMGGTHFNAGGTQAVVLDIQAGKTTSLEATAGAIRFDLPIQDLAKGSVGQHVGDICSAAIKIHRAVPEREFALCDTGSSNGIYEYIAL